jgi:hypothetical protein
LPQDVKPRRIVSYFKPNVTINVVDHFAGYPKDKGVPMQVTRERGGEGGGATWKGRMRDA